MGFIWLHETLYDARQMLLKLNFRFGTCCHFTRGEAVGKIVVLLALQNSVTLLYKEDHRENMNMFLFIKAMELAAFAVIY